MRWINLKKNALTKTKTKRDNEMASNHQFVKVFVAKIMVIYEEMLNDFLTENEESIDRFLVSTSKNLLTELEFIMSIPRLLVKYEDEDGIEIDYVFLKENLYEVKEKEKVSELKTALDELQTKIELDEKNSSFFIQKLYKSGNFILTFIKHFDFRKEVAAKLLTVGLEVGSRIFENTINNNFIQIKGNESNWSWTNF